MQWRNLLVKKALVNRLPFAKHMRKLKRHISGYAPDDDHMIEALSNYERIKTHIMNSGSNIQGSTLLEIGTGWFPVIPILLCRDGVHKVYMTDLNVHMDEVSFAETAKWLKNHFHEDKFIQQLTDVAALPLEYLAPFDPNTLADQSIDIITSHNVLEHIPASAMHPLFSSLKPKLSPNGRMIHVIDHSDHFQHYDNSISSVHFLEWSEEKHALINYLIKDGENRLRYNEYDKIFTDSGYSVIEKEADISKKILAEIPNLNLSYPYSIMAPEQIAAIASTYTLKVASS